MFTYQIDSETELRLIEERHAEELHALIERNRERLYWVGPEDSFKETQIYIKRVLQSFIENKGFLAGIWHKGHLVGTMRYNTIDWESRNTELGGWIDADLEGTGLVLKTCRAFIDYAFAELKLHRIEMRCKTDNHRSRKLADILGFTHEGLLREAYWERDHFADMMVYGLLAREWQKADK